jgi:hypothetical protein
MILLSRFRSNKSSFDLGFNSHGLTPFFIAFNSDFAAFTYKGGISERNRS